MEGFLDQLSMVTAYNTLKRNVNFIDNQYEDFVIFMNEAEWRRKRNIRHDPSTIINFAETNVNNDINSMKNIIWQIEEILTGPPNGISIPGANQSFLVLLLNHLKVKIKKKLTSFKIFDHNKFKTNQGRGTCMQKPNSEILHEFYATVRMTQLKGYIMIGYSYMIKEFFGKGRIICVPNIKKLISLISIILGDFSHELEIFRKKFQSRTSRSKEIFLSIMDNEQAIEFYSRCEPEKHIENETFVRITRLFEGVVRFTDKNNIARFSPQNNCNSVGSCTNTHVSIP